MTAASAPGPRHVQVPDGLRAVKRRVPEPVKSTLRQTGRRYGIATASHRVLPDFLIVGTKRGGTTSLWNWLMQHPAVAPMFPAQQQIKSPHYFDINFSRGWQWYRSHFPTREHMRRLQARLGSRAVTGEASPYYMFHPGAPARISAALPDARIIILLRDPVTRAHSNYWERRGSGCEDLTSFEEALHAEAERLVGAHERLLTDPTYYSQHHDDHSYLARGRYVEHIIPWVRDWPAENLLILRSEDVFGDPSEAFRQVQQFLGISIHDAVRLNHYHRLPAPRMLASTRQYLARYYRPYNSRLYQVLGRDLGWEGEYPC